MGGLLVFEVRTTFSSVPPDQPEGGMSVSGHHMWWRSGGGGWARVDDDRSQHKVILRLRAAVGSDNE